MPFEFIVRNGLISQGNVQVTSSVIADAFSGSLYGTSSQAITASYWDSSSVASELNKRQFNIATGSLIPVTSSWANNSISASYWNSSSVATRIDTLFTNKQNNLATGSTIPITASWALNAISASYAPFTPTGLQTGSTYPITSSHSITASYWNSSSVATRIDTLFSNKQNNIATGSTLPITASNADFLDGLDSTYYIDIPARLGYTPAKAATAVSYSSIITADTRGDDYKPYQRDAGFYVDFKRTDSSSFTGINDIPYIGVLTFRAYGNSIDFSGGPASQLAFSDVGGLYLRQSSTSASWGNWIRLINMTDTSSLTWGSASYWNSSSVATRIDTLFSNKQNNLSTGSTYPITSSWAINAVSASYWNSSSVATRIDTLFSNKQNNLATGSTIPITSSWAINSISASYWNSSSVATRIDTLFTDKQNNLATGSTIPITSSQSITASYWNSSSVATRIDTLFSNKQNNLATGSTIPITASWATTAVSVINANPGTGTNNYLPKWSSNTLTATSNVYDNGTYVGIGTISPQTYLYVQASGTRSFVIDGDGAWMQIGGTNNSGRGSVMGSKVTEAKGSGSLNYSAYWCYDAYYDEVSWQWKPLRTTLDNKWKQEMSFHSSSIKWSHGTVQGNNTVGFADLMELTSYGTLRLSGSGTQATPTTLYVFGTNSTTAGDSRILLAQSDGGADLSILVAGTDSRSDGLTANDSYIIGVQALNLTATGNNGTTKNTSIKVGGSSTTNYTDIAFYTNKVGIAGTERMRISGSGQIGIGTPTPRRTLDITGSAHFRGGFELPYLYQSLGVVTYYPSDAAYANPLPNCKGTVKITLPSISNSTMLHMKIRVWNYLEDGSSEIIVAGYKYNGGPTWINSSAVILGGLSGSLQKVRLAHSASVFYVLLGDTTTTLQYPTVAVESIMASFTGALDDWTIGWSVTQSLSESGLTIDDTINDIPAYSTTSGTSGYFPNWNSTGRLTSTSKLYDDGTSIIIGESQDVLRVTPQNGPSGSIISSLNSALTINRQLRFDASQFEWRNSGGIGMFLTSSGFLGVNTANPKVRFHVSSVQNGTDVYSSVPTTGVGMFSGAGSNNRLSIVDGQRVIYIETISASNYAHLSTYDHHTDIPCSLALQVNGGMTGFAGIVTPKAVIHMQVPSNGTYTGSFHAEIPVGGMGGDVVFKYPDQYNQSRNSSSISLLNSLGGRIVNMNTEFHDGIIGYTVYDNASSGKVTMTSLIDTSSFGGAVPNSSGRIMRLFYNVQAGTYGSSPSPGWGGWYIGIIPNLTGSVDGFTYRAGSRVLHKIWARISSGSAANKWIGHASNATGDGFTGVTSFLTSNLLKNNWQQFLMLQIMGNSGSFNSTGFFYVGDNNPTNTYFQLDVARHEMVDLDVSPTVQYTNCLNVGWVSGSLLKYGQFATRGSTYLAAYTERVGIGTTSPTTKLEVVGSGSSVIDIKTTGRISSGGPGEGGIWVDGGINQFVGSKDGTHLGMYASGWNFLVNTSGNATFGGTSAGLYNTSSATVVEVIKSSSFGVVGMGGSTSTDGIVGEIDFFNTYLGTNIDARIAYIRGSRSGGNNSGKIEMSTKSGGVWNNPVITIGETGTVGIVAAPSSLYYLLVGGNTNLNGELFLGITTDTSVGSAGRSFWRWGKVTVQGNEVWVPLYS